MKKANLVGYVGLCLLQGQNLPLLLKGFSTSLAFLPVATPIMVIVGLACYLHHSLMIGRAAMLYTIGNSIGILSNCLLLYLILR